MTLNIKYFGLLAEVSGCDGDKIEFSGSSVSELLSLLFNKHPELKEMNFQIAQNNEIISKESVISKNEIALLPPFSGG